MRKIIWIVLLFFQATVYGQKVNLSVTDLLIYQDSTEPGSGYAQVFYSGNIEKLKNNLKRNFLNDSVPQEWVQLNDSTFSLNPLNTPRIGFNPYQIIMTIQPILAKSLIRFDVRNVEDQSNYMIVQTSQARRLLEVIQSSIDEALEIDFSHEQQSPNTIYIFTPEDLNANLFGYLFLYSRQPKDTIMNKLCIWLVSYCDEVKTGYWVDASTYRIDDLNIPELGIKDRFSLTIEYKKVEKGYTEYVLYLTNYHADRPSLNYSIRYHDLHKRLWHLYSYHLYMDTLIKPGGSGFR